MPNIPGQTPQDQQQINQQNRQQRGTGFTNISQILGANQGAGAQMGATIGNKLQGQATGITGQLGQATNQFNTDYQAGIGGANTAITNANQYLRQPGESDTDYTNRLGGANTHNQNDPSTTPPSNSVYFAGAGSPGQDGYRAPGYYPDPATFTQDKSQSPSVQSSTAPGTSPDYANIGKSVAAAHYGGPTGLNNADSLSAQAQSAQSQGQLARSSQGQQQLLRNLVASRGGYTAGQAGLDQLLLGHGGQQAVQSGAGSLANIGTKATNAINDASAQANYANTNIENGKTSLFHGLQAQLNGDGTDASKGVTGIQTTAENRATAYQKDASTLQALMRAKINDPNVSRETLDKIDPNWQADEQKLSNPAYLKQLGIDDSSVYTGDPASLAAALGNVANNIAPNSGGMYFQGNEEQAAKNLASLLGTANGGDTFTTADTNNKFNANMYNADPSTWGATTGAQQKAQAQRDALQDKFNNMNSFYNSHVISGGGNTGAPGYNEGASYLAGTYGNDEYNNLIHGGQGYLDSLQSQINNSVGGSTGAFQAIQNLLNPNMHKVVNR